MQRHQKKKQTKKTASRKKWNLLNNQNEMKLEIMVKCKSLTTSDVTDDAH